MLLGIAKAGKDGGGRRGLGTEQEKKKPWGPGSRGHEGEGGLAGPREVNNRSAPELSRGRAKRKESQSPGTSRAGPRPSPGSARGPRRRRRLTTSPGGDRRGASPRRSSKRPRLEAQVRNAALVTAFAEQLSASPEKSPRGEGPVSGCWAGRSQTAPSRTAGCSHGSREDPPPAVGASASLAGFCLVLEAQAGG